MMVTCEDYYGFQCVSLPYSNLNQAVSNISLAGTKDEKLRLNCGKIEDTAKLFFIYIVNEKQASMGIFNDNEYIGEYSTSETNKKVYLKEAADQEE